MKPQVLVLGPGSGKAFLMIGFLMALEQFQVLDGVKVYIGVSAGSMISLLRVIGYQYWEIAQSTMKMSAIYPDDCYLGDAIREVGLFDQHHNEANLTSLVERRWGSIPTMQEIYDATGLTLEIVAYNVTTQRAETFNWKTSPAISCVEAVLLSINVPLLFRPRAYQGNFYLDGALGNPYPVDHYDDKRTFILGIYILKQETEASNPVQILDRILESSIDSHRYTLMSKSSSACRHVTLIYRGNDIIILNPSSEARHAMLMQGFQSGVIEVGKEG